MRLFTIISMLFGGPPPPPRPEEHPYATATTPDMLIANSILNDVCKNPKDWHFEYAHPNADNSGGARYDFYTKGKAVDVRVPSKYNKNRDLVAKREGATAKVFHSKSTKGDLKEARDQRWNMEVYELDNESALYLFDNISKWKTQYDAAEQARAKALEEMRENERKWNYAERLTGLTRNAHGALVPRETICQAKDCLNTVKAGFYCEEHLK